MKKNTKTVIIVMAVLVAAVGILAWLNRDSIAQKKTAQQSGTFFISANGRQYNVSMEGVLMLSPRSFRVNAKSSTTDYTEKEFTGVSLKVLLDHTDVDYSTAGSINFIAADGYASAISISDALDEDNCFIVFEEDGKPLGTKESGGSGPFRMIMAKDEFAQRWCKFLLEIKVN